MELVNFRLFSRASFRFGEGAVAIVGPNGAGKTALLEAVAYLSVPKSFRGAKDAELVRWGERGFHIKGLVEREGAVREISVGFAGGRKEVRLGGKRLKAFGRLLGEFVALPVASDARGLATGNPEERRRFVDRVLSSLSPEYYRRLLLYKKALKAKNAALKRGVDPGPWNRQLEREGRFLVERRRWLVERLNEALPRITRRPVRVHYKPSADMAPGSLDRLREKEAARGFSLAGPHLDIFWVSWDGRPVKIYGSGGEQRVAELAVVLATRRVMAEALGSWPVLLLDEPFSVLDEAHTRALLEHLEGQVLFTDLVDRGYKEVINLAR